VKTRFSTSGLCWFVATRLSPARWCLPRGRQVKSPVIAQLIFEIEKGKPDAVKQALANVLMRSMQLQPPGESAPEHRRGFQEGIIALEQVVNDMILAARVRS
jgi:hypothetical protein